MRKHYITHENLRKAMLNIQNDNLTDENIERFLNEIKHSCLIIAANINPNGVDLALVEIENRKYALLFTDMDEFRKLVPPGDVDSYEFDFEVYKGMVEEELADGFIINPASEGFIFKKELVNIIQTLPEHDYPEDDALSVNELKDLKDSINNNDLEYFINDSSNIGLYDELFTKLSNSTLLTLMLSRNDLSHYACDGVIELEKTGPLGFLYLDEIGGKYATVYTSEDKISNVNTTLNKYSQLVNFSMMTNFILNDDLDGIIINPNSENIMLSRDVLLRYSGFVEKNCNDSRLNTAIKHMFIIEGEVRFDG